MPSMAHAIRLNRFWPMLKRCTDLISNDGNRGQHPVLTEGAVELKIDVGLGYRIYLTERSETLIVLLVSGDKSTQD
jgi:putative addiction module killer protein